MKIFVSYSSKDRPKVVELVKDLKRQGHEVWYDFELGGTGAQKWWDNILSQIRSHELFVFSLSQHALNSTACQREYAYAYTLRKRILPILIGEVDVPTLPRELQEIQFVDYKQRSPEQVIDLTKSLANLPPNRDLPDPLPTEPDAPIIADDPLPDRIESRLNAARLTTGDQKELIADIEYMLQAQGYGERIHHWLLRFYDRQDVTEPIREKLESLIPPPPVPVRPVQMNILKRRDAYDAARHQSRRSEIHQQRLLLWCKTSLIVFSSLTLLSAVLTNSNDGTIVRVLAAISLILAPIVLALRSYRANFQNSITWLTSLYLAESLLAELFLYRMGGKHYRFKSDEEALRILLEKVEALENKDELRHSEVLPYALTTNNDSVQSFSMSLLSFDNFEQYKTFRVDDTNRYYRLRTVEDYRKFSRSSRVSLGVLLMGAVIASLGLSSYNPLMVEALLIAAALSEAIVSNANIEAYDPSATIYQKASESLYTVHLEWLAEQNSAFASGSTPQNEAAKRRFELKLVEKIETVLEQEREHWYQAILDLGQAANRMV